MQVAIAGAGIAGLSAALALARRGFQVRLLESAETLEEIGAGIQLSPNAVRVLQALGLAERIGEEAVEPAGIAIYDGRSGRLLTKIPLGETARRRYGAPYLLIHRADLQACLRTAAEAEPNVRLELGRKVRNVRPTGDAVRIDAGDETADADLLLAADGIHSVIRTSFFGHEGPSPAQRVAWRATIAAVPPPGIDTGCTGLWLGPGVHLVHYPMRGGAELNVVVIAAPNGEGAAPPLDRLAGPVRALGEAIEGWSLSPLEAVDPHPAWRRGRVALIGDAAHGMLPTAAQGGAQAIEDAWIMAACLDADRGNPEEALRRFEAERRPRVRRIAREAARNLAIYGLQGMPAAARNLAISLLPPELHLARLDWLFDWPAK
jgi:salicylate hydroxylase